MSNFSQFFPSSGGNGIAGGGIPINGYAPMTVSATSNPVGYNATTGLYTHPDGTYWTKTGFTVSDPAGAYPNATSITGLFTQSATTVSISPFRDEKCIVWDGVYFYAAKANVITEYNASFVATGFSFTLPFPWASFEDAKSMLYDPVNSIMVVANNNGGQLFSYNHTAGASTAWANREEQNGVSSGNIGGITYVGNGNMVVSKESTGDAVFRQTTSLATTPAGFSGGTLGPQRIIRSGGFIYAQNPATTTWDEYVNASGLASTGRSFAYTTAAGIIGGPTLDSNGSIRQPNSGIIYEYTNDGNQVGDAISRTDTDSTKPLFVRIK